MTGTTFESWLPGGSLTPFASILERLGTESAPDPVIEELVRLERVRSERAEAAEAAWQPVSLVEEDAAFTRALNSLRLLYQPVISWSSRKAFAHEALLRTTEPHLDAPGPLLVAAERLQRMRELGQTVRRKAALTIGSAPAGTTFLVNVDALDLLDRSIYAGSAPLSRFAPRVILEITERAALDDVSDTPSRIARLRDMGFRIAVDDLGSGYADLASVALLEPDLVKLDMSLIRGIQRSPVRQKLVRWIATKCREMGVHFIAEGIETRAERDALVHLGCDLLQGHLFARPGLPFPRVSW